VDWPDELASALMQNPSHILSRWGMRNGLAAMDPVAGIRSSVRHLTGSISERGLVQRQARTLSKPQWNRWPGSRPIWDFPTSPT
jgi:hypothetical protein